MLFFFHVDNRSFLKKSSVLILSFFLEILSFTFQFFLYRYIYVLFIRVNIINVNRHKYFAHEYIVNIIIIVFQYVINNSI